MLISFTVVDFLLLWLWYQSTSSSEKYVKIWRLAFWIWWLMAENVKLIGLYRRNVWDIFFLPLSIFFGYFHGFIKLYGLMTLYQVRSPSHVLARD